MIYTEQSRFGFCGKAFDIKEDLIQTRFVGGRMWRFLGDALPQMSLSQDFQLQFEAQE